MAPGTAPQKTVDFRISFFAAAGVIGGLGCLTAVIAGGLMTGKAFKEGMHQVLVHAPSPLEFKQIE